MAELVDVIHDSIDDATGGSGEDVETGVDSGGSNVPETTTTDDSSDSPSSPSAVSALTPDEIEQELASHGIKPPMEGQRENRIPYTRVRKILENARKKEATAYEAKLKERETELEKVRQRAREADSWDQIVSGDEVQFLTRLSQIHPKYQRFLQQQAAKVEEAKTAPVVEDPEPQPDYKFEDGSLGYTPEGYKKHNAWLKREAVREAEAAVEKKYGPTIKSIQEREAIATQRQRSHEAVQQQYRNAESAWGQMFVDDWKAADKGQSEVLKYMGEHKGVSLADACAAVFLPKIRAEAEANKTKIRGEVVEELNKRPAAASTAPKGQTKSAEAAGPKSIEDVIRESIAHLR